MESSPVPPSLCSDSLHSFRLVRSWLERRLKGRARPLVVGVGGPGGCGKSTLSRWLRASMEEVEILAPDDFRLPRHARPAHGRFGSHPEGNDLVRLESVLEDAKAGRLVKQPVFDPVKGEGAGDQPLPPAALILADGEIAAHARVRPHFDHLILVDAHWRTQLNTRLTRDLRERNCSLEKAVDLFLQSNLRDYPAFAAGAEDAADIRLYRTARKVFTLKHMKEPSGRRLQV